MAAQHTTMDDLTQQSSPLLRLPAELRNQIYSLLFVPPSLPSLRRLSSRSYCSDYVLPHPQLPTALLQTCSQLYTEILPILYGQNTFSAHPSLLTGLPFLVQRSRPITHGPGKSLIRKWHLVVRLDTDPGFCKESVEKAFTDAEELEIEVFQAMFNSSDYSVLRLFEGVRGIGRASVGGSVGDGRFARWLEERMMMGHGQEGVPFEEVEQCVMNLNGRKAVLARTVRSDEVWAGNR